MASQFNAVLRPGIGRSRHPRAYDSPLANVALHRVPGAFEIPIVVRELAQQKKADVILALGVILKGRTKHAENLARSVTDAFQRIALDQAFQ